MGDLKQQFVYFEGKSTPGVGRGFPLIFQLSCLLQSYDHPDSTLSWNFQWAGFSFWSEKGRLPLTARGGPPSRPTRAPRSAGSDSRGRSTRRTRGPCSAPLGLRTRRSLRSRGHLWSNPIPTPLREARRSTDPRVVVRHSLLWELTCWGLWQFPHVW